MGNKKPVRTRGKIKTGRYFQKFEEGDSVSVVREIAMQPRFPKKLQGQTGTIESRRGKAYMVKIKDQNKEKGFLIEPIHLKKINKIIK